ncbi:MAG: ABC transporter substrate-binding protein, partial [Syntrophales bacterium LBB04]|nr:ABC transporter substrate-binding protein [Syntrophales bacterium LBB04]
MKATKMVLAVAGIILGLVLLPSLAMADKTIGMLLFSGETRYNEAAQGIRDRLIESGFGGPGTVFIMENAAGNKARAAELVEQLRTKNPDLLATMGTNATMAAGDRIKDLPIVFSVVYDPVVSGIAKSWQGSGNNTAGVSSKVSLSKLIESLTALKPIARLAVLFTPAEQNSLAQLGDLKKLQTLTQARNTFEIVPVNISKLEEIQPRVADVLGKVDAVYITGSNLVDSQVEAIVDMANKARVITVSHLDDL